MKSQPGPKPLMNNITLETLAALLHAIAHVYVMVVFSLRFSIWLSFKLEEWGVLNYEDDRT